MILNRDHAESAMMFRDFACLALDEVLGLHASGKIDDTAFALGDAQLAAQ